MSNVTGATTGHKYDRIAKTLHWLIGALVILELFGGNLLEGLAEAEKPAIAMIHSGVGSLILTLMALRLIWRIRHPPPALLPAPGWQLAATRIVHWGFYVLVILQPITGIIQARYTSFNVAPFGLFNLTGEPNEGTYQIFHELHEVIALLIIGFLALHVVAALYHHLVKKDTVLKRMTWGKLGPGQ